MRRIAVLTTVVAVSLPLMAGGAVSAATFQVRCASGAANAPVGGKRVCLQVGQPCMRRFATQYRRFGFDCTSGVLGVRSRWKVTDLGALGTGGQVTAINEQGQVIGERGSQTRTGPFRHAFLWQNGKFTDLAPVGSYSQAGGINNAGQIIGWWLAADGRTHHSFLWQKGMRKDLGDLDVVALNEQGEILATEPTADSDHVVLWQDGVITDLGLDGDVATALNDHDQVVARNNFAPGDTVVWDNGVTTHLGPLGGFVASAINAKGQILGQTDTTSGKIRAALWDNGLLRDLGSLDGGASYPHAINDSGQVIGQSSLFTKGTHKPGLRAFLWQDGVMRNLGTLGIDSFPIAINDLGQVVGWSLTTTGNHAFVWKNGHMSDLGTLPVCSSTAAVDINDHDQIIGVCYTSTGQTHALMWAPRNGA